MDVYRRVGAVRAEPWQGASSFFQEHLIKWRELNSAEHFLKARASEGGKKFPGSDFTLAGTDRW